MKKYIRNPLLYIFLLGIFLRLYSFENNPAGLFRDDAAKGYNAYCIMQTGRDIDGNLYPIFTRELLTYNSALYSYLIIPFYYLFGINEFAIRFPSALFGALTILALYWMMRQLFSRQIALLSSLFLAISPWHIVFSRWAHQGVLLVFCITLALGYLWKYFQYANNTARLQSIDSGQIDKKKYYYLILSFILFAFCFYTYDISKLFIPLLLMCILIIYWKYWINNKLIFMLCLGIFILLSLPVIYHTFYIIPIHPDRFWRISIFQPDMAYYEKIFLFIQNWLWHLSPQFLFLFGDDNLRHSMPQTGQLYLFESPLILLGIYYLLKNRLKENYLLLCWLLLYAIPANLTLEGIPHGARTIIALPLYPILSAIGLSYWMKNHQIGLTGIIRNKSEYIFSIFCILALFNISFILVYFYRNYPALSAPAYQYGMKQTVEYSEQIQSEFDRILVSPALGFPEIFYRFYTRTLPEQYLPYQFNLTQQDIDLFLTSRTEKILFIGTPYEFPQIKPYKIIFYPDGTPAVKFLINPYYSELNQKVNLISK